MRILTIATACVMLGACAVVTASGPKFDQVPKQTLAAQQVRIYVYRTKAFYLAQASTVHRATISVDDHVIGYLANGGFLSVDVPAGHHSITAASGPDFSIKQFDAPAGASAYIRIHDKTRTEGLSGVAVGAIGAIIIQLIEAANNMEGRTWGVEFVPEAEAMPRLQELVRSD